MKLKRYGIVLFIMLMLISGVGVVSAQQGTGGRRGDQIGRMPGTLRVRGIRELVQVIADATGLEPVDILKQVRQGSSLADIITANGATVEDVRAQAVEKGTGLINQAVKTGRITQERADQLLVNLETRIDQALNFDPAQRQMQREVVLRVAGETGLPVRQVLKQWQEGSTLNDILTASGEEVQAFMDETITRVQERLDQAVQKGRLTQEQADRRLSDFKTFLPDFLNQFFPISTPVEITTGV